MSRENVEIVRQMYEAFSRGDLDGALNYLDPEVAIDATHRVDGRVGHGRAEVTRILAEWLGTWDEWREDVEETHDLGDRVLVVTTQRGRGKGSGIEMENRFGMLYELRRGMITRWTIYDELSKALEAAGLQKDRPPRWPWILAIAIFVSTAGVAQAADLHGKRVAINGTAAAGPSKYDRLWVRKYGPTNPSCVLVLSPGSPAGQGGFARIAPEMTQRVKGLDVWAIDRRPNAMEDVSVFKRDRPRKSLGYYLLGDRVGGAIFKPVRDSAAGFVRDWGAATAVGDLRNVIQKASERSSCVMIGGHSFGTLLTEAYLAWDFNGTPGYQGLDGIVLIDGGLFGAFKNVLDPAGYPAFHSVAEARARIAKLQKQSPFGSDGSIPGLPSWVPGVVPEIVCQYALKHPNAVSGLQKSTIGTRFLPGLPSVAVSNEAFAGLFFKETAGDEGARTGRLSNRGNPLRWRDGRYSSVSRFCSTFTQEPGNGLEWYFPNRLMIDVTQGLEPLKQNAITDFLGLRPFHLADINLPLYVIQTKLSDGGVLRAAHKFIRESKITRYKLVNDPDMDHVDPLVDYPNRNRFLKTVVPFLKDTMARAQARHTAVDSG